MAVLLLTIVIVCVLIAAADLIAFMKAEVTVEAVGNVQSRDSAECLIRVRNKTFLPIIYKRLGFRVDNTFTQEKKSSSIRVNVLPFSESEIRMDLAVRRCGKIRCTVSLGLFGRKNGKNAAFCNFTVLPEIFSTHVEYSLHESDIYDSELYSQFRKGQDYSEIYQIREYVPGDNVKYIHWKLSGRTDTPMVKEASFPLDKSLMIIMDKSVPGGSGGAAKGSSGGASCTPEEAEALASITVSIARCLSDEGLNYQLVWNRPDLNACETRDVQFESDLADAVPSMLTGPVITSGRTCAEVYCQTVGPIRSTHVIYISCGIKAAEMDLFENMRVTDIDARAKDYAALYREIDLY